jgi:hypothetical protein
MLGDKLGEEHGRVTTRRILPGEDFRYIQMEISFETEVTVLGVQGQNIGTYKVWERIPGQMYAEGQGIIMTADGEGAIWNGHGVGHMTEQGVAFAASVAIQTNSTKLQRLNECLMLVEHHADNDGGAHSELYEWKA